MLEVIAESIKDLRHKLGRHLLFIGSSVKIPPDDIALSALLEQLASEQVANSFQELAAERRGTAALEQFAQQVPDHAQRCQLVRNQVADARPAEGHTQLAYLVKEGYFPTIFTMCPDNLLQQALHTHHLEPDTDYHLLVAGVDDPDTISVALKESTRLVIVKCGGDLDSKYLPLTADEIDTGLQPISEIIADAFSVLTIFTAYTQRDRPLLTHVPRQGGKVFWVNPLVPVSDEQMYTELKLESPASIEYHRLQPEVVSLLEARQSARHMLVREAGGFNEFFGRMRDWFQHRRSRPRTRRELTVLRGGPYRFLDYFDVQDTKFFFGRDQEITQLIDLISRQPLAVLFGRSGVGKTSLIKAGVTARLLGLHEDDQPAPDGPWLTIYARCEDDPRASIAAATRAAVEEAGYQLPAEIVNSPLAELLAQTAQITAHRVVLFLDQFEELFVKLGQKVRDEFVSQLRDYLQSDPTDTHLVLSIREDFLGPLHELEAQIPDVMHHLYRLRKLDQNQARSAILKPAQEFDLQVERELVGEIVDDLYHEGIEPAQLQIVCHRLYEGLSPGSRTITHHTYERLGKAAKILSDYLDYALSQLPLLERRIARAILKDMAVSSELKATRPTERIAQEVGQSQQTVERVLAKLVDYRLLRSVRHDDRRTYELVHEYLSEKLQDWMSAEEIKLKDVQDLLTREFNNFQKFGLLMYPEELRIIGEHRRDLHIAPEELELIVRSAVTHDVDAPYWLGQADELGPIKHRVLASLMTDSSQTVRPTVYEHLDDHLHRDLIPALIQGLEDEAASVRRQAREYLKVLESDLTRLLKTGQGAQRRLAAEGLGQIGSHHSEQLLIEALTDEDQQLTETITESLRQLGEERAANLLLRRISSHHEPSWAVAYALGQLSVSDKAIGKLLKAARGRQATAATIYALGLAQSLRHEFDEAEANLQQAQQAVTTPQGRQHTQQALQAVVSGRQHAAQGTDRWPMLGGNPQHTGYAVQTLEPPLKQTWATRTEGAIVASPVVSDGIVYIGSRDNSFYALDSQRGRERFRFTTNNRIEASAVVVDDTVIFGSTDANLYALDAASGEQRWQRRLSGPIRGAATTAADHVFVGDESGTLWAIDAATGSVLWQRRTEGEILSSPAVAADTVVVGSWDNSLYAYRVADGEFCWRVNTNGPVSSSPAISGEQVFCGSDDAMVYAVELASGQIAWQAPLGGKVRSSPAIADGRVVVGCTDSQVYCLDQGSGEIQWRTQTGEEVLASALIAGQVVYIGSKDGTLYALDLQSGQTRWQYPTPYGIYSTPAVAQGTLYIGIAYYYVAAFRESEPTGAQ